MAGNRDAVLARRIAVRAGLRPRHVEPIVDLGRVNHVFVIHGDAGRHVVRFALDPLRTGGYEVEAWCLTQAAARGIPSPQVVGVGSESGVPYLVETFVEGAAGTSGGSDGWRVLGAYARIIHEIPLDHGAPEGLFTRFGRDPTVAWRAHLNYNLNALDATDPLLALAVYPPQWQSALRDAVRRLSEAELAFGLIHGDLSLRNLLLSPDQGPVLLDWDTAAVGPVPDGDLVSLLRAHQAENYPNQSALEAFADGCGLKLDDVLPMLRDHLVLGHLDLVRWARDRRPDLLAETVAASRSGVEFNLVDR